MKYELDDYNTTSPACWQCVLYYCVTQGSLDIALRARFVSIKCWTDELALLGCQRMNGGDADTNISDPCEKFDRLYKHAYRFMRIDTAIPFKQHHKYEIMGSVLRFEDWDDINTRREQYSQTMGQNQQQRGNNPFDAMCIQFTGGCVCQLEAEDERPCDSVAWFCYVGDKYLNNNKNSKVNDPSVCQNHKEEYKGYNKAYMQQIVGKVLMGLWVADQKNYFLEQDNDNADDTDYENRVTYVFVAQDGQQFPFILCHRSNGYYSGSLRCEWYLSASFKETICQLLMTRCSFSQQYPQAEIIIVVGLPASGKSTYTRQRFGGGDTLIFDDDELEGYNADMLDDYFVQMALHHLLQNKKVCFVSARFCNPSHYQKFLDRFPPVIVQRDAISIVRTILFENDNMQCLANNEKREAERLLALPSQTTQVRRDKMRIDRDIQKFNAIYHPMLNNTYTGHIEYELVYAPTQK